MNKLLTQLGGGASGLNLSKDAVLGLKNFGWASKTRHSETPQAGSESVKKCAFTLAEVLITLGIIGVVAALTIPTLMQKMDERETVSKVKKAFSTISNAVKMATVENGEISSWGLNYDQSSDDAQIIGEKIAPHLNVIKDCGTTENGCFATSHLRLDGNWDGNYNTAEYYKVTLSDGTAISIRSYPAGAYFVADVNGLKKPNQLGKDTFIFFASDKGKIYPHNAGPDNADGCSLTKRGHGCSNWIIQNDNMDYLDE